MKTAIQELKEHFREPIQYLKMMKVEIDWDKYIKKEKEQIIDAYMDGHHIKDEFYNPEEYYNETYQNK